MFKMSATVIVVRRMQEGHIQQTRKQSSRLENRRRKSSAFLFY